MMKRQITVLDAPSNLGLRPPEPGAVPGCYKLPWALRDRNLLAAIHATDAGSLVPHATVRRGVRAMGIATQKRLRPFPPCLPIA